MKTTPLDPAARTRRASLAVGLAALVLLGACAGPTGPVGEGPSAVDVHLVPVADGFAEPLGVANAGDGSGRLFVVERRGRVRAIDGGTVAATPYLDLGALLAAPAGENGLLGLAFDPGFATSGELFVHYVDAAGANVVGRLRADPPDAATVDLATLETVLRAEPDSAFHLGGHLAFGPDGYLYVGLGDGGTAAAAQDLGRLHGGLLRLDVDAIGVPYAVPDDNPFVGVAGARPETWAYGLRNPWRFAFDAATGDLWIGDVGQNAVEEVDRAPSGAAGGANYGWPVMEGDRCYPAGAACDPAGLVLPLLTYAHADGFGSSVTGGAVYRGAAIPGLVGAYVFGDFVGGTVFVAHEASAGWVAARLLDTPHRIASFGVDEAGELLLVDYAGGGLFRLAPGAP